MRRAVHFFAIAALVACDSAPRAPAKAARPNEVAPAPVAASFDDTIDDKKMVVLCDPAQFRMSIRTRADAASLDRAFPQRRVIDPETLVAYHPNFSGEPSYRGPLIRYEQCGPFTVQLQGDFFNSNINGEMGAIPPFAAVTITADNRLLYPESGGNVRLTDCDTRNPRWDGCPERYAIRVDLQYVPDAAPERLVIQEWVESGDLMGGETQVSERRSSLDVSFEQWRLNRR